ncbi:MAG: phosphoribosyl-AMP cyclohydrolase, partial [Kiritimatiellia bacterium]|nr:phosphoribosyl-AMP cyclohydrolase [Kiritimatiellia bacterium]
RTSFGPILILLAYRTTEGRNPVKDLEEGSTLQIDFCKIGKIADACRDVIPVAVQNADTGEVILVAYSNELAFNESVKTRTLVLWSTSRNELWIKGKTSGETFELLGAYVNCEQNSLLYKVRPRRGNICHTNNKDGQPRNCFYREVDIDTLELKNLDP